jgi:hypothetical protein
VVPKQWPNNIIVLVKGYMTQQNLCHILDIESLI